MMSSCDIEMPHLLLHSLISIPTYYAVPECPLSKYPAQYEGIGITC